MVFALQCWVPKNTYRKHKKRLQMSSKIPVQSLHAACCCSGLAQTTEEIVFAEETGTASAYRARSWVHGFQRNPPRARSPLIFPIQQTSHSTTSKEQVDNSFFWTSRVVRWPGGWVFWDVQKNPNSVSICWTPGSDFDKGTSVMQPSFIPMKTEGWSCLGG